jgi:hypothetical protein
VEFSYVGSGKTLLSRLTVLPFVLYMAPTSEFLDFYPLQLHSLKKWKIYPVKKSSKAEFI